MSSRRVSKRTRPDFSNNDNNSNSDIDRWEASNVLRLLFPRRFYAVTSRRYNTASYCNNSISRSVMLKHQHQQQPFVWNDKPTSQLTTRTFQHPDNSVCTVPLDISVTGALQMSTYYYYYYYHCRCRWETVLCNGSRTAACLVNYLRECEPYVNNNCRFIIHI